MHLRIASRPADDPDADLAITRYRGVTFATILSIADGEMPDGWIRVWVRVER